MEGRLVQALEGRAGGERSGARMEVAFTERAEEHSFTTALASCLAKFGRESAMKAFNRYWARRVPDVKPTAGYTTDGRRWLADMGRAVTEVPRELVIRDR